ncbi:MAG: hypothetical protein M3Y33_00090 [Actinomycetota bacterium]|nr:hypothetical protein [Actinomycetota bacterium]
MNNGPAISEGPRTLPLMTAGQRAALDPYMALVVGYRKSGLSLNHIVGCPLDCGYCVRHFWGNFDVKVLHLLCPDEEAVGLLTGHHAFRPHTTPIQLLNKATDPFLPGVRPHLFKVLHALDQRGYTNHVLVITRFKVAGADMAELEALHHLRVTLLFTYSGIADPRVEPIAKSQITVTSIRTVCDRKQRTGVVLYWRPIVPGWNDQPATMAHVLDTAQLDAAVIAAWRDSGISTPLFRKTSCAVAYAHSAPDYNGHWGIREICDICPAAQQQRCSGDYRQPAPADLDRVLDQLGYDTPYLIDDGHIWTHGLGEQRRYAIQHTLRYQIWELDQPHYLHSHGRAPHGHAPDPEHAARLAALRAQLTDQAR